MAFCWVDCFGVCGTVGWEGIMGTVNTILVRVEKGINACLEEASLQI